MNIKPMDKTIKELLISGRQFVIPRFQREYSWDKKNYQEFYEDILNNLSIEDGNIKAMPYFLGTMLFVGNYDDDNNEDILVVDGQQRLTTITILFSALSEKFKSIGEDILSEQIFRYIMTKDDNGENVRILKSKTHYPFFSYFIQEIEKENIVPPSTDEEISIKETYDFFDEQLNEESVKEYLRRKHQNTNMASLKYEEILKSIRDQVLQIIFISISTTDKTQSNKIFEILNAKGKKLANIDLIKNKIFEVLDRTEPADYAEEHWNNIKTTLKNENEGVGFATFYRHYWISKYKKSSSNKLYDDFNIKIIPKNKEKYKEFIEDMEKNASNYMKIIAPKLEHYSFKKEYQQLIQSLDALSNIFNIVQVRVALLALFDLKDREKIKLAKLNETILFLENFHFAYNAICAGSANKFETIYTKFAIKIRTSQNKQETNNIIKNLLIDKLTDLLPNYEKFREKFIKLTYSKKPKPNNTKVKYIINKLHCFYSKKEAFELDGSIEHIMPEKDGEKSLNIGNLILLELVTNRDLNCVDYKDKRDAYLNSNYKWAKNFAEEFEEWNEELIEKRAENMAKEYYEKILKPIIG